MPPAATSAADTAWTGQVWTSGIDGLVARVVDRVSQGAPGVVSGGGRGVDDVAVVARSTALLSDQPQATATDLDGLECLSGDADAGEGCVVAQLQPRVTAAAACVGLGGEFLVRVGSTNGAGIESYAYAVSPESGVVPETLVTDGAQGQTFSWAFAPTSGTETSGCAQPDDGSWRTFRIDVVRSGIEESLAVGPVSVGLSSGSATVRVRSTQVGLVPGTMQVGLAYRSPGGVGYISQDPTNTLPGGWALDGLGDIAPWVSATQVGTGDVPQAVVLTGFDGQQVQFTNTLAGSGSTTGVWAPPTQAGWSKGQFGSLIDSGDLTADDSTLTWSSGQQVVTFVRTGAGVWGVDESLQVGPGGQAAPSVQAEWDGAASPARLSSLTDPASGKQVSFIYGAGGTCAGQAPPTDGSDVYVAPTGLLCGWENFDGRTSYVWYAKVADSDTAIDAYQVAWVQTPGGRNTQLSWASDGVAAPQLVGMQMPLGWDAQSDASVSESASSWRVNYDIFGNVESVVSPVPGVDSVVPGADADRIARVFSYNTSGDVQWTSINHGVVDNDDPTQVTIGASMIDEVRYDGAWRPTRYAVESSRPGQSGEFFIANKVWDTVNDRLLATETPNGRQTVSRYDFLGRVTDRWGPAPTGWFTTDADGQVVPDAVYGDDVLMTSASSYDADDAGLLAGLSVSMYPGSTPGGVPAATLGSCADGQCGDVDAAPLSWTELPTTANVSNGDQWSMTAVASREAPVDASAGLWYRVTTDDDGGLVTFSAAGSCATDPTSSTCASTVAVPATTAAGQPVTLQVQYLRDSVAVTDATPVEVTIEESTDGGATWTELTARDMDPGFGLSTSHSQSDTFEVGGDVITVSNEAIYLDPQRQQVSTANVSTDGVEASMQHGYEAYDGASVWGRTLTTTDLGGTTVANGYWAPTATTTNPCTGASSVAQAGLQSTFTMASTATGEASGTSAELVYDLAGRAIAQTHTSEDGAASYTTCRTYDERDQVVSVETLDGTLKTEYAFPWNGTASTGDPFTTAATHTAPDTTGSVQTYTSSTTVDLLGRAVSTTGPWGTTTVTEYGVDPVSGVRTTVATSTTSAGYTMVETTTINADGTTASVVRSDGTTSHTTSYGYNDDATIDTVTLADASTEVVTETREYHPTSGAHVASTWTQGSTTLATDDVTDAPNATRILREALSFGGVTYTWNYTYGGLSRLVEASLDSSDDSIGGTWEYAFERDSAANSTNNWNPDAHLNGNITAKTVTPDGGTAVTYRYHYDFADRLVSTDDPALAGITYDSFNNMTQVGANTLTYNTQNAPVAASDGDTTVAYTRLLNYPIIEKATTTSDGTTTIRYSSNGLILDGTGRALSHIQQLGPVTITTPAAGSDAVEATYQVATLTGNRFITLDVDGTPTTTVPDLFDPYGVALTNTTTNPTVDDPDTPNYAWQATATAETETLELPYVMMGARMYVPEMGRFTSPDPHPGRSGSEYSYARSDPINFNDPDGLEPKWQRAFGDIWNDFANFWKHDFTKPFVWAFGKHAPAWHVVIGIVVIVAVIVVVVVLAYMFLPFGATVGTEMAIGDAVVDADAAAAGTTEAVDSAAAATDVDPDPVGDIDSDSDDESVYSDDDYDEPEWQEPGKQTEDYMYRNGLTHLENYTGEWDSEFRAFYGKEPGFDA